MDTHASVGFVLYFIFSFFFLAKFIILLAFVDLQCPRDGRAVEAGARGRDMGTWEAICCLHGVVTGVSGEAKRKTEKTEHRGKGMHTVWCVSIVIMLALTCLTLGVRA